MARKPTTIMGTRRDALERLRRTTFSDPLASAGISVRLSTAMSPAIVLDGVPGRVSTAAQAQAQPASG